jgi:hydrogenase-4 component F
MMTGNEIIIALFTSLVLGILLCVLPLGSRAILRLCAGVAGLECAIVAAVWLFKPDVPRIFAFGDNLFLDALSLYHISLVAIVFFLSSLYSLSYFSEEIASGQFPVRRARRFGMIWNGFFTVLMAVLCSNNLGLLWVCLEATTLVSALLILTDGKPASIEAMWKYLLLCSVGIAFAFIGTLLLSVAAHNAALTSQGAFLWTTLNDRAGLLDGRIMLAAFIFILVGFGTKAGLAPMHTWLPDAHSQAPTPVSAVFSGIMLNCALYCIMRYLPLCEGALGWNGRPHSILLLFGLFSIIVAAIFIPAQKNIKRLLAYCSVEHIGIIALGVGIGGLGTFAALFHTFNHSLSKSLAFFSAGRLARQHGAYDMSLMKGSCAANPLWGTALFVSILALFGAAPFSIFMSELQLVKASIDHGKFGPLAIFLFCAIVVFISALRWGIKMCMGKPAEGCARPTLFARDYALVIGLITLLLAGGLVMPHRFERLLKSAATIIDGSKNPSLLSGGGAR